jgi:hypothetical protein
MKTIVSVCDRCGTDSRVPGAEITQVRIASQTVDKKGKRGAWPSKKFDLCTVCLERILLEMDGQ